VIRSIGIPFWWGFAEATVFFVVPDVAVGLIALFRPSRAAPAAIAAVAGGVAGSIGLRAAIRGGWNPEPLLRALPGTTPADLDWARGAVALNAIQAFLTAAVRGTPVKVLTAEATQQGMATARLVLLVVLNRAPRIGVAAAAMAIVGLLGRPLVTRRPRAVAAMYAAGWIAFYAWFWSSRRA
jgi:membrane protein YqaA with SNARE-associated domain